MLRAASAAAALASTAAGDPDTEVRRRAVESLGAIGTEQAGEGLLPMVEDPRASADTLSGLWDEWPSLPRRRRCLPSTTVTQGSDLARDALEGLARIGAAEARGTFYHELSSRDGAPPRSMPAGDSAGWTTPRSWTG